VTADLQALFREIGLEYRRQPAGKFGRALRSAGITAPR